MKYLDFHCHLDYEKDDKTREEIVTQCFNGLLEALVTVADPYSDDSIKITKELINKNPDIWTMVAAHPHEASKYSSIVENRIVELSQSSRCIAIGEGGLDFHYNLSPPEVQKKVFRRQIDIAKDTKLPLLIHSRSAEKEVLEILEEKKFTNPVIFHCYTGSKESAIEILKRGYYISVSGIVTFKKAEELREVVKLIPQERIFTETDSPFLAPVPHRGKTNIPPYVKLVADFIAQLKGMPIEDLKKSVYDNFKLIRDFRNS